MSVGRSGRTPGKHRAINSLVCREMVIAGHAAWIKSVLIVDATAGDAAGEMSTPAIVERHLPKTEKPVIWVLFERDKSTFRRLRDWVNSLELPGNVRVAIQHADSTALPSILGSRSDREALLYLDDPNSSGTSTLTPDVVAWIFAKGKPAGSVYASIATNATVGQAAAYEAVRDRYLHLLDVAERAHGRGAVLCRLKDDPARWGYLWIGPESKQDDTAREFRKAFAGGVVWRAGLKPVYALTYTGFSDVRQVIIDMTTRGDFHDSVSQPTLPFAYIGRTA